MSFKFTGIVKHVGETVQVTDTFSRRDIVVTDTSSMYPQHVSFQLTKDKCALGDTLMEGESVEVSFNLNGREWTSPEGQVKYFNTLEAWRIDKSTAPAPVAAVPVAAEPTEEEDDLPF